MVSLPHVFTSGQSLTHTHLNDNNNTLTGLLNGNLRTSNIHPDGAGITAKQLADRYAGSHITVPLIPWSYLQNWSADLDPSANTNALFQPPDSAASGIMFKQEIIAKAGQYLGLTGIHVFCAAARKNTNWPKVEVRKNGATIGTAFEIKATDATTTVTDKELRLIANSPWNNPLVVFAHGDLLEITAYGAGAPANPYLRGLTVTLYFKWELAN